MSDTTANLRRKIDSAGDLQAVVRTMKAMAASSIGQYEKAVRSLDDYYWTVQLGLAACFRQTELSAAEAPAKHSEPGAIGAVVFGSDQGLVGQFNDVMADFVVTTLALLPGKKRCGRSANGFGHGLQKPTWWLDKISPYPIPSVLFHHWLGRF